MDNNADTHARIIKQLINPTDKYPYSMKKLIELVNRKLKHRSISFVYNNDQNAKFSRYHFRLFIACYDMKQEKNTVTTVHHPRNGKTEDIRTSIRIRRSNSSSMKSPKIRSTSFKN